MGYCTAAQMGRKFGTEVGVNSSFVALIATESVSIAIPWPLLPPEVGVNRHGPLWDSYFITSMHNTKKAYLLIDYI